MSYANNLKKQSYERFKELFELGLKRRLELETKGETRRRSGMRAITIWLKKNAESYLLWGENFLVSMLKMVMPL